MKILIKIVTVLSAIFALSGCNSDNKTTASVSLSKNFEKNISMVTNKAYVIKKGDIIEKVSNNPEFKMSSNLATGETIVTLLSGEASIIRK